MTEAGKSDGDPVVEPSSASIEQVEQIAKTGSGREITELPAPLQNLPEKDRFQDIKLKRIYALSLLVALGVQIAVVDAVFVVYAWVGVGWKLPLGAINIWLGATVVEVIGIVAIVTRYLFPRRDTQPDDKLTSKTDGQP